jgi:hypothetical protein
MDGWRMFFIYATFVVLMCVIILTYKLTCRMC